MKMSGSGDQSLLLTCSWQLKSQIFCIKYCSCCLTVCHLSNLLLSNAENCLKTKLISSTPSPKELKKRWKTFACIWSHLKFSFHSHSSPWNSIFHMKDEIGDFPQFTLATSLSPPSPHHPPPATSSHHHPLPYTQEDLQGWRVPSSTGDDIIIWTHSLSFLSPFSIT